MLMFDTKGQDMSELEDKVGDKKSIHSSSVLKQSIHLPLHSQKDLYLQ